MVMRLAAFLFMGVLGLAVAAPAKALVMYSYTGNPFTDITDQDPPSGTFDTTMLVSGFFTVDAPLSGALIDSNITGLVQAFSLSNGRSTLTETTANTQLTAEVSTDANGDIVEWDIRAVQPFNQSTTVLGDQLASVLTFFQDAFALDQGRLDECTLSDPFSGCIVIDADFARVEGRPGTWLQTTVTVPEPSTLLLFGVGLAGLAALGWRRRQVVRY